MAPLVQAPSDRESDRGSAAAAPGRRCTPPAYAAGETTASGAGTPLSMAPSGRAGPAADRHSLTRHVDHSPAVAGGPTASAGGGNKKPVLRELVALEVDPLLPVAAGL